MLARTPIHASHMRSRLCSGSPVNVSFLQSGLQFRPPVPQRLPNGSDSSYRSTAQRLADFHSRTAQAVQQASMQGMLPK